MERFREWYYPGGYIYAVGNRPRRDGLWSHDGWLPWASLEATVKQHMAAGK